MIQDLNLKGYTRTEKAWAILQEISRMYNIEYNDMMALYKAIEAIEMPIPAEEELPEEYTPVLVWDKDEGENIAFVDEFGVWRCHEKWSLKTLWTVTKWLPVPEALKRQIRNKND